jgi:putative transposase
MNDKYLATFYEGGIFHIYNRTNNKEPLFKSDENRLYFLKQYAKYLQPFVDTFCWCLLPNHFHFLVKVKTAATIKANLIKGLGRDDIFLKDVISNVTSNVAEATLHLKPIEAKFLKDEIAIDELLEFEWRRFFISYSMAFNKQHKRTGNLFQRPFKRVEIDKERYFTQAIIYIHANAVKHKIVKDFTTYPWSSYPSIISDKPTLLNKQELIEWFGGIQQFIQTHKTQTVYFYNSDVAIEDE